MRLTFIDQPRSDEVVFQMISFDVNKYLVIIWKNGISVNYIVIFDEQYENMSLLLVNPTIFYESSHENGVVIFQTFRKLENIQKIV